MTHFNFTGGPGPLMWQKTEEWDARFSLACPVCGGDNNHIKLVSTERSANADEAHMYPGTSIEIIEGKAWRRSAARIDIDGECGHSWALLIQQHKGELFLLAKAPDTDRRIDDEKRPQCSPEKVLCHDVVLQSRYEKLHEYRVMAAMINDLSPILREQVTSVLCDSKAGAFYTVELKSSEDTLVNMIATSVEATAKRTVGGYNGITLQCREAIIRELDPDWPEGEDFFRSGNLPVA